MRWTLRPPLSLAIWRDTPAKKPDSIFGSFLEVMGTYLSRGGDACAGKASRKGVRGEGRQVCGPECGGEEKRGRERPKAKARSEDEGQRVGQGRDRGVRGVVQDPRN